MRSRGYPRHRISRRESWSINPIGPIAQSPLEMSTHGRDTGFPEPFCGSRNTTLPHPEAKIGASACLTEDDIGVSRAMLRNRMSFMEKTQTRAMSGSSLITLDMQQMHNDTLTHSRSSSKSSSNDSQFGSHISKLALSSLRSAELTSHLGGGDHSPKDHHSVGSFSSEDASRDGHGHHHYNGGRRDSRRKRIVRKLLHRS